MIRRAESHGQCRGQSFGARERSQFVRSCFKQLFLRAWFNYPGYGVESGDDGARLECKLEAKEM